MLMIAQLIFFVALVLFLILLIRRFNQSPKAIERTGAAGPNLGERLVGMGSSIGGWIARPFNWLRQRIPLFGNRRSSSTFSPADIKQKESDVGHLEQSHRFWQDEAAEGQPEIAGFFDEGDELFKKGEYSQAEKFFLKAATRTPGDARVYARLGVIYLHGKNYSDAIEVLKVAVKLDHYNPSRHYNLALAYHGNNDRQKAISSTREAIALDPVTKKYRALLEQLTDRE